MLHLFDEFFRYRALQRRVSSSVTAVGGGFLHTAAPVWAHVSTIPSQGFELLYPDGSTDLGQVLSWSGGCEAQFIASRSDMSYAVRLPYAGAVLFEELSHFVQRLQHPTLVVLADAVIEPAERWEFRADTLLIVPMPAVTPAGQQSQLAHALMGHVREAVSEGGGRMEGVVELPTFGDRLSSKAELASELYVVRFRLIIYERAQNTMRYAMRV